MVQLPDPSNANELNYTEFSVMCCPCNLQICKGFVWVDNNKISYIILKSLIIVFSHRFPQWTIRNFIHKTLIECVDLFGKQKFNHTFAREKSQITNRLKIQRIKFEKTNLTIINASFSWFLAIPMLAYVLIHIAQRMTESEEHHQCFIPQVEQL